LSFFNQELEGTVNDKENSLKNYQLIYLELLDRQRELLNRMNHHAEFDEELIRKFLSLIDIEEFNTRQKLLQNSEKKQV